MKKSLLVGILALGLVAAPVSSANAADVTLSGVVTRDGVAVSATEVGWIDPTTGVTGETKTDATGSYALSIAAGRPYILYAGVDHTKADRWKPIALESYVPVFIGSSGTDYMFQSLQPFVAPAAPVVTDIALPKPGSVTGTNPALAKQRVDVFSLDDQDIAWADADADGTFTIRGLIPGNYKLALLDTTGYVPYRSESLAVTAGSTTMIDPVLDLGATLTGVITVAGKPVKGVQVSTYNADSGGAAKTDKNGRYVITGLRAGSYSVVVNGGYEPGFFSQNRYTTTVKQVSVKASGVTKLNARLKKGGAVTATVSLPKSAQYASVVLLNGKREVVAQTGAIAKHHSARLALRHIGAGKYTALFTETSGKVFAKQKVMVKDGSTTALGSVALSRKTISVTVKLSHAAKATVLYFSEAAVGEPAYGETTHGRYLVTGVIPGYRGELQVFAPHHEGRTYKLRPTESMTKSVEPGTKQGRLVGTITLNGLKAWTGSGSIRYAKGEPADFGNDDGTIVDSWARAGTGRLDFGTAVPFVERAPFWTYLDPTLPKVTVVSGKVTNVGELKLQIGR